MIRSVADDGDQPTVSDNLRANSGRRKTRKCSISSLMVRGGWRLELTSLRMASIASSGCASNTGGKENIRRLSVQSVPGKFVCGEILEVECNDGFRTGPTGGRDHMPVVGVRQIHVRFKPLPSSAMAIGKALQIASRKPRARTSGTCRTSMMAKRASSMTLADHAGSHRPALGQAKQWVDDPRRYEQVGVKQRNHKGTLLIEPGQVIRIVDVVRAAPMAMERISSNALDAASSRLRL